MKGFARRLEALEHRVGKKSDQTPSCIVIHMIAPGPDGPEDHGPWSAHILKGPNAGLQLRRRDDETFDAFEARCDAMVEG